MAEKKYLPPKNLVNPFIKNLDEYDEMYQESISDPQTFFGDQAEKNLSWVEPFANVYNCLLYTSPSPRDGLLSRMPSSA